MRYFTWITTVAMIIIAAVGSCSCQKSTRDYAYEAYCDSIWENDPDYYLDVLVTTDEFQDYIEANGRWWAEASHEFDDKLIEAQSACLGEAERVLLQHGIYDEYYSRKKFTVDSLLCTQL